MDGALDEHDLSGMANGSARGHLILAEVVNDALTKHKQGKTADYYAIIEHLSVAQMKPVVMQRWLQALSLCVSRFTKDHGKLVGSTLKFIWYDKDPETVDFYLDYLTNLLSAHAHHLRTILSSLTKHLWSVHGGGEEEGGRVFDNIHRAIQSILAHSPMATSVLMQLITKGYPFRGKGVQIQEISLRNVLYVSMYCPSLRDEILELVVYQMLTIDVELPNLEGEAGDPSEGEDSQDTQFHVELDTSEAIQGEVSGMDGVRISGDLLYSHKPVMRNEQAEKLDVMMTVCLRHFHGVCHSKGSLDLDESWSLLHSLLQVFERVVLPTHACSHVQFLLFWLSRLHQDFPGYFLDFLWKKFQDPNVPAVFRQTTSAYIASYVARAKFVSLDTSKLCITIIMQWIHQYLDSTSPDNLKPDVRLHGPFYSLCQAAFYIFIFRNKSLVEMEGGLEFLRQLNFERVITSRLNPLKVCLQTVVEMFASLANRHQVAFSYTILEQNKRLLLSSVEGGGTTSGPQHNPLDCFFPFDPYHLKRSGKFMEQLYQHWEDADDQTMEEEEAEEVVEDHGSITSSFGQSLPSHSVGSDSPLES